MNVDKFKQIIARTAHEDNWSMEQIQLAEDYINALFNNKRLARQPKGLLNTYADMIYSLYIQLSFRTS